MQQKTNHAFETNKPKECCCKNMHTVPTPTPLQVQDKFRNPWASALGAVTTALSIIVFWDHHRRHAAESEQSIVKSPMTSLLRVIAILGLAVGIAAFLGFLISGLFEKEKLTGTSKYIPSIWGFVTAKTAFLLLYCTNAYAARDKIATQHFALLGGQGGVMEETA
eukprot:m.541760 g.541760  ORF g.541760 m.541760 type:complete len:165 (+) comp22111_c1_seq27:412-906(+)